MPLASSEYRMTYSTISYSLFMTEVMFHFTVTSLWRDCRLRVVFKASREALCAVRNRLPRYVAGAP